MNKELTDYFKENICERCEDKGCKRKLHRMMKCGILYLVKEK